MPRHRPDQSVRILRLPLLLLAVLAVGCVQLPTVDEQREAERRAAQLAEQQRQAARPVALCRAEPGSPFAFRKKVLFLSMPVARPFEAVDLPDLPVAWSQALQQRVQVSDRFLIRDGSRYHLDPNRDTRQQIIELAQRFDAQFVVAGSIVGAHGSRGRFELGPFATLPNPAANQRVIDTELRVYDGLNGTLLQQVTHREEILGRIDNPGRATLRGDFFQTPLGEAMERLIDLQGETVEDELACLPMQARIVHTEDYRLEIDAGFTSNLAPGDRLRIVQRRGPPGSGRETGVGELVINEVFPESAVGHISSDQRPDWRFGGWVRAW